MMPSHDTVLAENAAVPRYAVILRTHFWDEFAQRQLERLRRQVVSGDIFVLVDETNGAVANIGHDRVVRLTEQDMLDMGLPRAGAGNLLWFNGDYPLYYFLHQQPDYDYYLQLEYDVAVNTDIDRLIARAHADHADFVGLTKGEPVHEWMWLHTCKDAYRTPDIRYKLICLSLFSHRGLQALADQRLAMAKQLGAGAIGAWPFCEGFIATEMARDGFVSVELDRYTETGCYDSWPPFVESDLPAMPPGSVIHPVLDQSRYVGSLMKVKVGLIGYLNLNSLLHRKLRRLPPGAYLNALATTFAQKARRVFHAARARYSPA